MKEFDELIGIIDKLRENCPGDKSRTAADIFSNIENETEEIRQALQNNDPENLKEEIGDLVVNALFLAKIANETYGIKVKEILDTLNQKLMYRHPHVFENPRKVTIEESDRIWQERKMEQRYALNGNSIK